MSERIASTRQRRQMLMHITRLFSTYKQRETPFSLPLVRVVDMLVMTWENAMGEGGVQRNSSGKVRKERYPLCFPLSNAVILRAQS